MFSYQTVKDAWFCKHVFLAYPNNYPTILNKNDIDDNANNNLLDQKMKS